MGSSRLMSSAYHTWPARSSLPVHGDDLDNATSELKGREGMRRDVTETFPETEVITVPDIDCLK